MSGPTFVDVAKIADAPPGEARRVEVHGVGFARVDAGGEFFAREDRCNHMSAQLSDGYGEGDTIIAR